MILLPPKVAYRGTVTGLRISSVDGTAFLDALPSAVTDLVAADPGNYLLEIYDATGKVLKGYLGAAGTGETLGEELVTNGTFSSNTTGWDPVNGALLSSEADGESGNCLRVKHNGTNYPIAKQSFAVSVSKLYLLSGYERNGTSMNGSIYVGKTTSGFEYANLSSTSATWENKAARFTATGTALQITCIVNTTTLGQYAEYDTISAKQILTPSTSGCLIVSTKGGATQSFATTQAGFAYNQVSYNVVVRKAR